MQIKKIALHWQILIALIFAVIYGMVFTDHYKISKDDCQSLKKIKNSPEIELVCEQLQGRTFEKKKDFQNEVIAVKDSQNIRQTLPELTQIARKNVAIDYVSWMGDLFLRLLKMLIIPLILSSIITGVAGIGSGKNLGRLGLKTMGYYIVTSMLAIFTGLVLVNIIHPGVGADINLTESVDRIAAVEKSFGQLLLEIVPQNVFFAMASGDMLGIIFFAIIFGFFMNFIHGDKKNILLSVVNAIYETMMKITLFVIKLTPFGIFGIVAKVVAEQDDLVSLVNSMGLYMLSVLGALMIHAFITLPVLSSILGKIRPFRHLKNMFTPLLTAFSTSSSAATLPLTINAIEENSGVSKKVSSFTLPLGATINMDGTALYECVAVLFIAQAYGVDLTFGQQVIVAFTGLLASIGAAGIPMAGLVMITVILTAVDLPLEGVGLILAVDRILDMFRTATNVWSDSCGAAIIAKSEGEKLKV